MPFVSGAGGGIEGYLQKLHKLLDNAHNEIHNSRFYDYKILFPSNLSLLDCRTLSDIKVENHNSISFLSLFLI